MVDFELTSDLPSITEANVQDVSKKRGWFPDPKIQEKWEIPEKVIINAAISGRSATEEESQSGKFPRNVPEFVEAADEVISNGAAGVHFDLGNLADASGQALDQGKRTVDVYREILVPLRKKHGNDFVADLNILRGRSFKENLSPVVEGLAEIAITAAGYNIEWVTNAIKLIQDNGSKPQVVVHGSGEIGLAKKRLIETGILEKPYHFILLIANPNDAGFSPFSSTYVPDQFDMCKTLVFLAEQIRNIDRDAVTIVCAAGRATQYLTTLAMMLGLHVRIGTEDTVWRYPHRDEVLESNVEMLSTAMNTAKILGRKPATAAEFRKMIGIKEKPIAF